MLHDLKYLIALSGAVITVLVGVMFFYRWHPSSSKRVQDAGAGGRQNWKNW